MLTLRINHKTDDALFWKISDKLHREDGPAFAWYGHYRVKRWWYLEGAAICPYKGKYDAKPNS
jgi:hypothetical protein